MEYFTTTSKASRRAVDCVIVGIYERGKLGAGASDIDTASKGAIKRSSRAATVSGSSAAARTDRRRGRPRTRVAVVGLGKVSEFDASISAAAAAVRVSQKQERQILNCLTLEVGSAGSYYLAGTRRKRRRRLVSLHEMKSGRKHAGHAAEESRPGDRKRGDAAKATRGCEHGDAIATACRSPKTSATCRPMFARRATSHARRKNSRAEQAICRREC